ncbi:hypothetical protein [Allomesorhizobium camelthorni]|uniref:Uncharacterized protein n=1 Tax=Allomesorhizobium camelthorni TaxID=475069 RepID=A0A6G4WPG8_9HYPH|nr:hypothetical protein [Mesorhizobium camelthorni]NGO56096.1 hypothetical protein [Mesorhizobium camelthorni]
MPAFISSCGLRLRRRHRLRPPNNLPNQHRQIKGSGKAKNKQLETDAAEVRIRATRRLGELMAAQREAGLTANGGDAMKARVENKPEHYQPPITLAEAGIDKNLANEARKLAAIPETEFDGIVTGCGLFFCLVDAAAFA